MRPSLARVCAALAAGACLAPAPGAGQTASPLAGVWTLNRSLSEFPKEIGFTLRDLPNPSDGDSPGAQSSGGGGGGGRGRRAAGGGNRTSPFAGHPESYEDGRRRQLLMEEVRTPPARLMIVDSPSGITMTNELGQSRTLHANGRDESVEIQGVAFTVNTRRDGDRLVVLYHVEQNRDVRYTYSAAGTSRLSVEAQLLDSGAGDKATRVYEAGVGTETAAPATSAQAPSSAPPQGPPGQPAEPGSGGFDQRPGAEFKGLTTVGILVEDFGAEAVACGLNHDAIQDALARRLTAGGLTVRKNSDEDTYVYVNVISNSTPTAGCVSRYDAFLYTHATAKLTYHAQPVLVQVSLIHRGGIGASTPAGHAGAVSRALEGYIDIFLTQIRDANK
jgi:hypothetical protein